MPTFPLRFPAILAAAACLGACTSRFTSTVILNDKRDALIRVQGDRPLVEFRVEGPTPVIATTTDAQGSRNTQTIQAAMLTQTIINGGQIHLRTEHPGDTQVQVLIRSAAGISIDQPAPANTD